MRCPLALAAVALFSAGSLAADPAPTAAQVAFYENSVRPILNANCLKCHGNDPKKIRGGLNLTTRAKLLEGGDSGAAIDLKDHAQSLLLKAVLYKNEDANANMPPAGKLPDEQIATLKKWLEMGAPFPVSADTGGESAQAAPKGADKNYWAYQPVKSPAVPVVKNQAWVRTPIDAFLLQKLEAKNLAPNGPAEKGALLRRAFYDLTGLPPTPEQVDAFVADASPDAFARRLDELLASPAYGEKWARHWLDVVRYAETNGYERDGAKPFAWRYRDYVINSFNADKPYDRFLKEQIAGDEIPGENPDAVTATGFYKLGVWDDEPADGLQALHDGYDDLVSVVGQGVLAMTLNCARCHDHKGDFFPQSDYYKLLALMRDVGPYQPTRGLGTSKNLTDITPVERRKVYEAELKAAEAKIEAAYKPVKAIEDAAIKTLPPADQLAVEDGKRDKVVPKIPGVLQGEKKAEYLKLLAVYKELLKSKPRPDRVMALSVNAAEKSPPQTHVMVRGNPGSPGKPVTPGFPEVFGVPDPKPTPTAKSSGRRTALAEWLTDAKNPLTARVMVNRVWQFHFGRGIVPTPNDFGKFGEKPTHPELLDYLAHDFASNGWTLKRLHRQIMLSNAYQMSSKGTPEGLKTDPANALHWRFDMRRLAAEEVRDSILLASGKLNLTMGGPSVFPKIPQAILDGQSVPGDGWLASKGGGFDPAHPERHDRRSVYVHVKRSLQVPILATHDQADTDTSCPVRYTTTVPTQALGLLNGEFANEQAVAFAARLRKDAPDGPAAQVKRAIRLTAGRTPTDAEVARDVAFLNELQAKHKLDAKQALERFALLVLNTNEFLYLD